MKGNLNMKIVLLLANCTSLILQQIRQITKNVFDELEVNIEVIELERLQYYQGEKSWQFENIAKSIKESKGVVAISHVHIAGMHSSMQNFFEHLVEWEEVIADKPLFAITYSGFMGEKQAANKMIEAWELLGGIDGGNIALNRCTVIEDVQPSIEKSIEAFYRIMRQGRAYIMSSERQCYLSLKGSKVQPEAKKGIPTPDTQIDTKLLVEPVSEQGHKEDKSYFDLSTKEQNIQELTQLLKTQMQRNDEEFVHMSQATYNYPRKNADTSSKVKLHHIPHYFIGQHNRDINMVIQYLMTDSADKGVIIIRDGDCTYQEGIIESPTIEITMSQEILSQVLSKQVTYQKAFMIGKLKVRGNFAVLSKLDQVFKAM